MVAEVITCRHCGSDDVVENGGSGSAPNDLGIVTVHEEPQTYLVHLIGLGERKRLSDEASQTLAPRCCSISPRAPTLRSPCPPPRGAPRGLPPDMPPTNHHSNTHFCSPRGSSPTTFGKFARRGRR